MNGSKLTIARSHGSLDSFPTPVLPSPGTSGCMACTGAFDCDTQPKHGLSAARRDGVCISIALPANSSGFDFALLYMRAEIVCRGARHDISSLAVPPSAQTTHQQRSWLKVSCPFPQRACRASLRRFTWACNCMSFSVSAAVREKETLIAISHILDSSAFRCCTNFVY